jgi:hypothetical protein
LTFATAQRTGTEAVAAARTEAQFSTGSPLFYVFRSSEYFRQSHTVIYLNRSAGLSAVAVLSHSLNVNADLVPLVVFSVISPDRS